MSKNPFSQKHKISDSLERFNSEIEDELAEIESNGSLSDQELGPLMESLAIAPDGLQKDRGAFDPEKMFGTDKRPKIKKRDPLLDRKSVV